MIAPLLPQVVNQLGTALTVNHFRNNLHENYQ